MNILFIKNIDIIIIIFSKLKLKRFFYITTF